MAKTKEVLRVAMIVVGLLLVGLAVLWRTLSPGSSIFPFIDPDDYMGRIPPLMKLETYPRLVPWRLVSPAEVDTTVLILDAMSYACSLGKGGAGSVKETFDRVAIRETADTVTIETWLGPPEGDGFWPGCKGTGTGFPVRVELDSPLGNRGFVDPACDLDRYDNFIVCGESSGNRGKFETRRAVDSP